MHNFTGTIIKSIKTLSSKGNPQYVLTIAPKGCDGFNAQALSSEFKTRPNDMEAYAWSSIAKQGQQVALTYKLVGKGCQIGALIAI